MFEADSQNFASAPSVPRGFASNFLGWPSAGTIGGPWEEGGPSQTPLPLQTPPPPPPSNTSLLDPPAHSAGVGVRNCTARPPHPPIDRFTPTHPIVRAATCAPSLVGGPFPSPPLPESYLDTASRYKFDLRPLEVIIPLMCILKRAVPPFQIPIRLTLKCKRSDAAEYSVAFEVCLGPNLSEGVGYISVAVPFPCDMPVTVRCIPFH